MSVSVFGVRSGRQVSTVNGGAAGRVSNHQTIAKELGNQFNVLGFTAAGAAAGEFKQRTKQLRTLDRVRIDLGAVDIRNLIEEVIAVGLFDVQVFDLVLHRDGALGGSRAESNAQTAAGAVFREDLNGRFHAGVFFALRVGGFESSRSVSQFIGVVNLHTNRGVRANQRAETALGTGVGIPNRDVVSD